MKYIKKALLICGLGGLLFSNIQAYATPVTGYSWGSRNITYQNNGSNNFYINIWTNARDEWNLSTDVFLKAGTNSKFTAGNKSDSGVTWDGLAEWTFSIITGNYSTMKTWVNTYYTTQSHYNTDNVEGIATHEFGHALGLDHAPYGNPTVMTPNTFERKSSGTLVDGRPNKSPTSWDINTVNVLYDNNFAKAQNQEPVLDVPENILQKAQITQKDLKINHYSWAIGYSTLEARAYDADLIVSGIVKNKLSPLIKNDGETEEAFHQSEVAIENVIKGEGSKGDTIILRQIGGETDTSIIYHENSTELQEGTEVLMYLKKIDDNVYIPINEDESIFIKQGVQSLKTGDSSFKNLYDNRLVTLDEASASIN
ncbi:MULTISPECIES: matrixin family metalloprotease [unclassified Paenibacillus]|uniref:matrixin family metalloprotease n=1 Tax=Paenibacillus TaxID=44249 RepID=UPI0007BF5046|nr:MULTISPECIES: matrixin family metalloprotease [unclassified Paenibacillus]SEB06297.1 Matrixin [Paenibacillus sp. 276b]